MAETGSKLTLLWSLMKMTDGIRPADPISPPVVDALKLMPIILTIITLRQELRKRCGSLKTNVLVYAVLNPKITP
jgi:hypothetical protein